MNIKILDNVDDLIKAIFDPNRFLKANGNLYISPEEMEILIRYHLEPIDKNPIYRKNHDNSVEIIECSNCKAFKSQLSQLKAENEELKEFARYVIDSECWGNIDGGQIQEEAERLSLIKESILTEEDYINHSGCYDRDDIGKATIYHFTDKIKARQDKE